MAAAKGLCACTNKDRKDKSFTSIPSQIKHTNSLYCGMEFTLHILFFIHLFCPSFCGRAIRRCFSAHGFAR